MGVETAAYIGLALAAAGSATQAYTARKTAKDQGEAAAMGIRNQAAKQRLADAQIEEGIGKVEGSTPEDERAASLDQYMAQLRSARSQTQGGDVPVTGGRYGEDVAASKAAIGNYGDKVAGLLATIRAASDQRANEGYDMSRTASDVASTARNASGQAFLDQLRLNGIRPNQWAMAAGDIMKGAGGAMVSSAGARSELPPAGQTPPYVPPSNARTWGGSGGFSPPPR